MCQKTTEALTVASCWFKNNPKRAGSRTLGRNLFTFVILLVLCLECGDVFSQNQPESAVKTGGIVAYLVETINWYHGKAIEQQIADQQSDLSFLNDNRQISSQIVQLAFDFARAEARKGSNQPQQGKAQGEAEEASPYQRLAQAAAATELQVKQSQKDLQSLRREVEGASGKKRLALESQISETQSELAFQQAHLDALNNLIEFATESSKKETGAAGLRSQIDELARSVPSALNRPETPPAKQASTEETTTKPTQETSTRTAPSKNKEEQSGIWGFAAEWSHLSHKKHTLDKRIQSTDQLIKDLKQLRGPLVANLKTLIQSGDQVASQQPSPNPIILQQQRMQLDALTAQFGDASGVLLPLGKQGILLNTYMRTLTNWRETVRTASNDAMRNFLIRLGILVFVIGLVLVAGETWRKAIFRYIREPRRRYQLLLLRKIIIWILVLTIIGFTFASRLGSIATFAGLLTAGVAVALQNVILSVAGYFLLMGKYGIRVGDRVEIAGVTGEVVDIGLVRLHLLEFNRGGTDARPSGRVVAFSNSIVFQPTSGVFKKIPGTSFVWHEISLTFSPGSDYRMIQERVTTAVENGLKDHREEMERQRQHMERTLNSISTIELRPRTHLHFTASGIEVTVRFPVELKNAVEIDERMMRELYAAVQQEPKLNLVGTPTLRTDVSNAPSA